MKCVADPACPWPAESKGTIPYCVWHDRMFYDKFYQSLFQSRKEYATALRRRRYPSGVTYLRLTPVGASNK